MMRRFAFVLLLAFEAHAAAEICRFRALDAENPFRRWLGSQEVTCGADLDLPKGLWNVFVRGDGGISVTPLLIDGDAAPARIDPPLVPAATVIPTLPPEHTGVLYAPRRGSAFPVDGARVLVPADEPLWLFVLERSVPVAVVPIAPIAKGAERPIDARDGGPPAVIGWLRMPEPDRDALREATGVISPTVRAGLVEGDPLPSPLLLHGAFVRIAGLPAGNAELRVEGRGWLPDRRVVRVQRGVTVAAAPLLVRATGTLTVHWNTDRDLVALDRSVGSCDESEEAPKLVIAVSKCAAPRPGPRYEPVECTFLREETVDRFFGSLRFDDLSPGFYQSELRYGKLPPTSNAGNVGPLRVTDLRMFATYFPVHGSVTLGGEPLGERVWIEFPGGVGFGAADTDEYHAVLLPPPIGPDTPIAVEACDGAPRAVVFANEPMRPHTRFNIDILANELVVRAIDTFTREPLRGATVKLEVISRSRPPRVVFTDTKTTDDEGRVTWAHLPVRETHLTVSHSGYERRTLDSFTMLERDTHEVEAQLVPLRGSRGTIVSDRPFDGGAVVWFSPSGSETERADLAPDGTFSYMNRHTADETMAVVSASHPLWVLRAADTERREAIALRFPVAPAVAFDVWLAASIPPGETRYIGVAVGGVRVPQPVLAQHQTMRRDQPLMRGSGPHHIRDLLATGPIDVLLGPTSETVASGARSLDLFALPQFADVSRQRLEPGLTDVIFTPR